MIRKVNNNILIIAVHFYLFFFILSMGAYLIMDMIPLEIETILIYVIFVFSLLFGIIIGASIPIIRIKKTIPVNPASLLKKFLVISSCCVLIGWYFMISYYGSLIDIINNSFTIRTETIGTGIQIIPTTISYLSCFSVAGFPISLAMYYYNKDKKYIYYAICFFIVVCLGDLQTFGRIGILYAIFILVAYYRICIHRLPKVKTIFSLGILLVVLMLPRYIRGGNSLDNIGERYKPYLLFDISPFFESFLSIYAYYFSGIFALNNLLLTEVEYQYGQRNFSALLNLFNRIIPINNTRITIISDSTYIPYDTNIYTIIGEMWMDGGLIFLISFSILFGGFIGWFYKYKGPFALGLKLILITWILETPIYNVFSFGNFLFSFLCVSFITIFCHESKCNYCKL